MKFIKSHPHMCAVFVLAVLGTVLRWSFPLFLFIFLAYFLLVYLLRLPTSIGTTAYFLESLTKKREPFIGMYRYAYKHKTKSEFALVSYGIHLIDTFQFQEALDVFTYLLTLPGINPTVKKFAYQDLSIAQWKCGDLPAAIATMEQMMVDYEYFNLPFYTTLGYYYAEIGDFDNAFKYTNLALDEDDQHGPAYDNLGQIFYRMGDYEEAEAMFRKALQLKQDMVDSKFYLGLIAEKQGDETAARDFFLAASRSKVTGTNTVTPEQIAEKVAKYN